MADYFFKILTSLRNCNVACSPALRLGGASEQLSGLCLQKVHSPLFKLVASRQSRASERPSAGAGRWCQCHACGLRKQGARETLRRRTGADVLNFQGSCLNIVNMKEKWSICMVYFPAIVSPDKDTKCVGSSEFIIPIL